MCREVYLYTADENVNSYLCKRQFVNIYQTYALFETTIMLYANYISTKN